jgi:hypothetical protein
MTDYVEGVIPNPASFEMPYVGSDGALHLSPSLVYGTTAFIDNYQEAPGVPNPYENLFNMATLVWLNAILQLINPAFNVHIYPGPVSGVGGGGSISVID